MKGIYARISDDDEGTGLGVLRQTDDCSRLTELRQWRGSQYVDNDVSAFKRGVVRPEFERMLDDLRSGQLDGVVVYNLDRLARQPADLERLIEIYADHPDYTFATVDGDINLATDDGLTMARVMVAFANKASRDTGRRTSRKHAELAAKGEPVGRRMFGWQRDLRTLDPVEAEQARALINEVILGEVGISELTRRWNEAGVRTTTGREWSHQSLRKYLLNPRLVGVRTHKGKPVLDENGLEVRGTWEPLLGQDTYERLQLALGPVRSGSSTARRGARKYALTGLLRCGVCAGQMFGSNAREEGRFNYVCSTNTRATDRHTLSVSGVLADKYVMELVLRRTQREHVAMPAAEWAGAARMAEIDGQISMLMDGLVEGQLPARLVYPRVEKLENERAEMQNSRVQWLRETTGPAVQSESVEGWALKTLDEQRLVADKWLSAIYVAPARQRGVRFDPERLRPVWRAVSPAPLSVVE
jgi:DNA invertase Pin-like site-specific DNA recombinase